MNEDPLEIDDDQTDHPGPAVAASLIGQMLSLLLTGFAMMQLFPMLPLSTRLMLLALALLSLRLWGGLMLLIAGLTDLFIRDEPQLQRLEVGDAVSWTFLLVAIAMCCYRLRRSLQQLSSRSFRSILQDIFGERRPSGAANTQYFDNSEPPTEADTADRLLAAAASAIRGLLLLMACTVTATTLLAWIPRGVRFAGGIRQFAAQDPELSGIAFLAATVAAALLLANELSWRQLTTAQARMYLRSMRLELFFHDLRMLSHGRLRERLRRVRERVDTEK